MAKSSPEPDLEPKLHRYTRHRELHPTPKGVRRARSKANHVQESHLIEPREYEESPLFKRFFSLPQEIRNNIYGKLLVQPCKFDLYHSDPCKMPMLRIRPGPDPDPWNREGPQCANCHSYVWKQPQVPIFQSPARSQWAQPHKNAYLCDNCYWDLDGNVEGIPCMRFLPCLCGRRDNLAILLASKRFWNDAAPVFWSENWFAFEDPSLLTGFLTAIRPQVRSWLRRISFMPIHAYNNDERSITFPQRRDPIWNGWDDMKSCWNLLRLCEGLMELELDVLSLTRKEWAQAIRLIHVKKRVVFFCHLDLDDIESVSGDPTNFVWESHALRKRFDSPTTALLASSMTGERAIRRKALITHYSENTLHQRCGDYGVEFTEKMIEGRMWNS